MDYKAFHCEFKADTGSRLIKGYASTFGVRDAYDDVVLRGAFLASIDRKFTALPEGRSKIKALWLHKDPIGLPTVMKEDEKGLYVEAKIAKTQLGDEALELIEGGVVDEMSIGYVPKAVAYLEADSDEASLFPEGTRRVLKEVDLFEFSPVIWGANDQTDVSAVKALSDRLRAGELRPEEMRELTELVAQMSALFQTGAPAAPSSVAKELRSLREEFAAFTVTLKGN